jgi:hypothetical protein
MNGDRKYRQNGYQENGSNGNGQSPADPRQRFQPPRHPMDVTAPRLPRLVQTVTASRCYGCASTLPQDFDFLQPCPKCGTELRCCKQCAHFEPSARFQCLKPIPERVPYKDKRSECQLFVPGVSVAREVNPPGTYIPPRPEGPPKTAAPRAAAKRPEGAAPRNPDDARTAFENLFKK